MRNRLVNFRINDVYYPDPANVLRQLHGDDLLQGVVIDVTAGDTPDSAFVVVQVEGLDQPVIVPVRVITEAL